jgi:hypothetical protein
VGVDARPPTKPPTLLRIPLNRPPQPLSPRFEEIPANQPFFDCVKKAKFRSHVLFVFYFEGRLVAL